jgi:hypothetical protein
MTSQPGLAPCRATRPIRVETAEPAVAAHAHGLPSLTAGEIAPQKTFHRWFDRVAIGFWLGGIVLGTAGCVLGASLSYHHPVARVISVLWWGIYLGCLGASIGALPALFLDRTPAPPSQDSGSARKPATESTAAPAPRSRRNVVVTRS